MILNACITLFLLNLFLIRMPKAQEIKYLNGIFENEVCEISEGINGTCQKISNCKIEFETYRKKQSNLKICHYDKIAENTLVCCPENSEEQYIENSKFNPMNVKNEKLQNLKINNFIDFETCRDKYLPYRRFYLNNEHFIQALENKVIPLNEENCYLLDNLDKNNSDRNKEITHCSFGQLLTGRFTFRGELVKKGNRPNMAAIGLTKMNKQITYICGGTIITNKFIVTAAHCKNYDGKQVNTVRVGDRYLLTKEDDDIAQHLKIQSFISHPNYKSIYKYNDIALIKTFEEIKFNDFVVPSCIDDLNSPKIGFFNQYTVAGYGQTEDGVASNILLEIRASIISNEQCNITYQDLDELPFGIVDTQFCVDSSVANEELVKDTCYGDSGSPLQFKTEYEIFPDDFNNTLISHIYVSSTVLGIVSFGIGCGLKIPSVYTKLYSYRDWMNSVIENN